MATLFYDPAKSYLISDDTDTLTFDLLLSEEHNVSNTVTTHPVENGRNINDHIHNNPFVGGISGLISNFSVNQGEIDTNRALDAFGVLEKIWRRRELITVVTGLRTYKNIAITNISTSRSSGTGEAQIFRISFQEVKKVSLKAVAIEAVVNITNTTTDINRQSSAPADVGRTVPVG